MKVKAQAIADTAETFAADLRNCRILLPKYNFSYNLNLFGFQKFEQLSC
jgi:hypothetical protein